MMPRIPPPREIAMTPDELCRRLIQETGDAVILCDAQGVIRYWNNGAQRVFGFAETEAIGQTLDIIIPENLRARHWHGFAETVRTARSKYNAADTLAVPALRADDQRISVEFTITVMCGNDGGVEGMGAIIRDVTERFEEIKRLRQAHQAPGTAVGASATRGGGA